MILFDRWSNFLLVMAPLSGFGWIGGLGMTLWPCASLLSFSYVSAPQISIAELSVHGWDLGFR